MIKEALEWLVSLSAHETVVDQYGKKLIITDKSIHAPELDYPNQLLFSSLRGMVEYLKNSTDNIDVEKFMIHVASIEHVYCFSRLDSQKRREEIAIAQPIVNKTSPLSWMGFEEAKIKLATYFDKTDDRDNIIDIMSSIVDETIQTIEDDGLSQEVNIRKGITTKTKKVVPKYIKLAPFRTFSEIKQPENDYLVRLKKDEKDKEIKIGLFEVENNRWKIDAIEVIKTYMRSHMGDGWIIF